MQASKGPPRPKKWCEMVVFCCTYFRRDHYEQLLDFRKEYRKQYKKFGRRLADRFARKQAILWMGCTLKETAIGIAVAGKRIFFG